MNVNHILIVIILLVLFMFGYKGGDCIKYNRQWVSGPSLHPNMPMSRWAYTQNR